ncbi:hypothetical protein BOX15_Mlig023621g1 [Macrostomum lignano]|uniref:Serine/threonine-protein phosphatase n=1 Tax=Macrostomum lignano TaxID=282301 RepID=A0A267F1D3_9PLAT|nr:hypothetical protein BOX15_Mlig023621g3 [Macrostomum lignano]PAA65933.1 hypothetical protein BOX15_Mlig023621g2 [Macrostomum lignano]PAA67563.1 hypothetical protein BOX15_Mlig023621g1 [Macrostomum lignano]
MGRILQDIDLKNLANRLLTFDVDDVENHVPLTAAECLSVCHMAVEAMRSTDICIHIKTPINIVGDLHGQFHDLLRIFDALGQPPESRFLFLGDYIDRGKYSLEVMTLLFVLMLLYPNSVYLLRGNHETANICCRYGFKDEIGMRFIKAQAHKVLGGFVRTFQWMSMCAIIDGQIFCCHGGISPSYMLQPFNLRGGQQANVQALNESKKPVEPSRPSVLCDIIWADPMSGVMNVQFSPTSESLTEAKWLPNKRGCSFMFSGVALEEVMRMFQTQMLIRGHQVAQNGFLTHHNRRCVTVFSAPGYCGVYNNACSILQVDRMVDNNRHPGSFFIIRPTHRDAAAINNLFWTELRDI